MKFHLVLLPGDGIGPEVISQTCRVLDCIGQIFGHTFVYQQELIGGCAIDRYGTAVSEETLAACKDC